MRPSCCSCFRKHISEAILTMIEGEMGYPEHRWLAVGHMGEAEAESILEFPDLAHMIREERIKYMAYITLAEAQAKLAQADKKEKKIAEAVVQNAQEKMKELLGEEYIICGGKYFPDLMSFIRIATDVAYESAKNKII